MTIETTYNENDTVFFMSGNLVKSGKVTGIIYEKEGSEVYEGYKVQLPDGSISVQQIKVSLLFPAKEALIATL